MTAPYKYRSEIGEFKYTTIGIQVLSGIIMSATGKPELDLAKKYLFKPLEINVLQNIRIHNYTEPTFQSIQTAWDL
jgi:CubicO group peptidase (beta-lactamase class C family)